MSKKFQRMANFRDYVGELSVLYKRTSKPSVQIKYSRDVAEFIRPYFDEIMDDHEQFKVIHLNRSNYVVNVGHHSSGDDTGTIVSVKDVIRNALLIKTHSIICAHNHPSGSLIASKADIELTKKIKVAAAYFDISLLDHCILTRENFVSMADKHLF